MYLIKCYVLYTALEHPIRFDIENLLEMPLSKNICITILDDSDKSCFLFILKKKTFL